MSAYNLVPGIECSFVTSWDSIEDEEGGIFSCVIFVVAVLDDDLLCMDAKFNASQVHSNALQAQVSSHVMGAFAVHNP